MVFMEMYFNWKLVLVIYSERPVDGFNLNLPPYERKAQFRVSNYRVILTLHCTDKYLYQINVKVNMYTHTRIVSSI
jgi:hypothetical protein